MFIQWFGSGTDIDTIPGFLTGVYREELQRLGHDVEAHKREQAPKYVQLAAPYIVVQDVDPRLPEFCEWLIEQRKYHDCKVVLLTQSDWWVDAGHGINYADYVTDLAWRGAFDHIMSYSLDGASEYTKRGLSAEFMCATGAPSWWEAVPYEQAVVDVVYVGSRYNDREHLQAEYVNAIRSLGLTIQEYGERQPNGFAPFSKMRDVLARGRVVLALTTPKTLNYYGAVTCRVFTGPWSGRATVSNWFAGISDFFGDALPAPDRPRDATLVIKRLIEDTELYARTLEKQRAIVEGEHLYKHRVENIISWFERISNEDTRNSATVD